MSQYFRKKISNGMCMTYLTIPFMIVMCDSFISLWNLMNRHTLKLMSNLLIVEYNNDPIISHYIYWSMDFILIFESIVIFLCMQVFFSFHLQDHIFPKIFLVYFNWWINIPSFNCSTLMPWKKGGKSLSYFLLLSHYL